MRMACGSQNRWRYAGYRVDLLQGLVHVTRLKNGVPSVHPLRGPELRALHRLQGDYPETPLCVASSPGGEEAPRAPGVPLPAGLVCYALSQDVD
jgi:hypothetical protein